MLYMVVVITSIINIIIDCVMGKDDYSAVAFAII